MTNNTPESQPSAGSSRFKKPSTWIAIVGLLALGTVGFQTWSSSNRFNKGEAAYSLGDCDTAMSEFTRSLDTKFALDMNDREVRSRSRTGECQSYQTVAATQADPTQVEAGQLSILPAASDFLKSYPSSALAAPLRQTVGEQIGQQEPVTLASLETCNRLPDIGSQELLPNSDTQLPLVVQSCGKTYTDSQNFGQAINLYNQFIADYPDHEQLNTVEVALAQTLVEQAKTENPGEIPPPPLRGYTADGSTVVTIRNDSDEPMRIVFSGADAQFKELPPCEDCDSFGVAPASCPEKGPEAKFVLKPGQYDVLVRSIGDSSVTPFTGQWALNPGEDYYSCFYIVSSPF